MAKEIGQLVRPVIELLFRKAACFAREFLHCKAQKRFRQGPRAAHQRFGSSRILVSLVCAPKTEAQHSGESYRSFVGFRRRC
jgi:hypothetical protein